ncbi:excalibur calcium-binding domain-containing protein [Nocardia sp. NPDC050712]|uniref:excalibur calcium-binding domain-containing protein n=1 Tax=Nocardia sp. NPDC050712 TaxID=3155518 RepID=UPI0033E955A4
MHKSRTAVVAVGVILITVLVLTMSGCGKSKKKKKYSSSSPGTSQSTGTPYRDCEEAWRLGKPPIRKSDRGFSVTLDRLDGKEDGVACATRPSPTTTKSPTRTPTKTR